MESDLRSPSCILARQGKFKMNILLKILPHNLPDFIREEILTELFTATADAFGCPVPAHDHLSYEDCLLTYALFTGGRALSENIQLDRALLTTGDATPIIEIKTLISGRSP